MADLDHLRALLAVLAPSPEHADGCPQPEGGDTAPLGCPACAADAIVLGVEGLGSRLRQREERVAELEAALLALRAGIDDVLPRPAVEAEVAPAPTCEPCCALECRGCAGEGCTCGCREEAPRAREPRPLPEGWRPAGRTVLTLKGLGFAHRDVEEGIAAFRAARAGEMRRVWRVDREFVTWMRGRRQELPKESENVSIGNHRRASQ